MAKGISDAVPGPPRVSGVKDAGDGTAASEENLLAGEHEASVAGRKRAFTRQRHWHAAAGQWIPMVAVCRVQQEKFAIDGITKRKAARFRQTGDRVEKKYLALVRGLQVPGLAAVGGFCDTGFFAFALGLQ